MLSFLYLVINKIKKYLNKSINLIKIIKPSVIVFNKN
jgi:hypothetical protein